MLFFVDFRSTYCDIITNNPEILLFDFCFRKKNYAEVIKKYQDIARINEGRPYKLKYTVDGKEHVIGE